MPIRRATAWRGGQVLTAQAMNGGVSGLLADLAGRNGVIEYEGSLAITDGDDGNRYLQLPVGTTAQRPATPLEGFLRYNSTTKHIEHWDSEANAWVSWPMVDDIGSITVATDLPMVTYANFNGNGAVGLQRNQVSQGTHVHTGTPDAPTDLAAVANQNSDQIKLTWTEPNHGGSPITGYRINQSGANVATYNITGSPTEWTTPTLTVGTYTFTVQAKNVNGNGAASASVAATINA